MRDIVQDWWDAMTPEQRARFDGAFGPELNKQVEETKKLLAAIEQKHTAPVLQPTPIEMMQNMEQTFTVFLDGVIKRPMGESPLMLHCDWCGAKTPDRSDCDLALEDGWQRVGDVDSTTDDIICPTCAKELPE